MIHPAEHVSAPARFQSLKANRSNADGRARKCALLTLPNLYKEVTKGRTNNNYSSPYQGTGARCVNSLSARLLLTMFPPNAVNFRLAPEGVDVSQLMQEEGVELGELEEGLAEIERTVCGDIETSGMRGRLSMAFKHLVATGNGLLYVPDQGNAKFYPLTRFVVDRDGMGQVLEIVTLDSVSPRSLSEEVRKAAGLEDDSEKLTGSEDVDLYTHVCRDGTLWKVQQEINGVAVPGTEGSYPLEACPWIPLRIPEEDNEDYGTGLVYEYLGDFSALEKLSKAMLKGAASAAKVLWALDPNSPLRPAEVTKAESGSVLRFKPTELAAVSQEKFGDFNFVKQHADGLSQRLERAFGVRSSIQRNGERVTAEEIRYLAQDLEDTLGGIYSILSEDLVLPLVRRIMDRLQRQGRLPDMPQGLVKPRIVVGVAALGRGQDLQKLEQWAQAAQAALGPQVFASRVNPSEFLSRLAAASDINTHGLLYSEEEIAQQQQQETMQQAAVRAAPNLASAAMAGQPGTPQTN